MTNFLNFYRLFAIRAHAISMISIFQMFLGVGNLITSQYEKNLVRFMYYKWFGEL